MPSLNRLLATLTPADRAALGDALEEVQFEFKQTLQEPNQPITHAYFPNSGVLSIINESNSGDIVEVATIGPEGMAGFSLILGTNTMTSRCLAQIPGHGFRIEAGQFMRFVEERPNFRLLLMRHIMALLNQVAWNASCNRLHEVQERCARWLLQTHDRVTGDSFPLTQEFLAQMLGVHRPTVSIAAGILQKAGLISYVRGVITILDRAGLEAACCDCYNEIAREYDRLVANQADKT